MDNDVFRRNAALVAIDKVIDAFIVINIVVIAALTCGQVFFRYILRQPFLGSEELCYFFTIWLYLGAAAKASSEKGQLVARVLEIFIKKQKTVYCLRSFAAVLSTGVLCWLTYWGYDLLKYSLRMQKTTDTLFLSWTYIEAVPFVVFAMMLVYSAIEAWEYFKACRITDPDAAKIAEEVAS